MGFFTSAPAIGAYIGGGLGLLTSDREDRLGPTLIGAGMGAAGGYGVGRLGRYFSSARSPRALLPGVVKGGGDIITPRPTSPIAPAYRALLPAHKPPLLRKVLRSNKSVNNFRDCLPTPPRTYGRLRRPVPYQASAAARWMR